MKKIFSEHTMTLLVVISLSFPSRECSESKARMACQNNGTLVKVDADTWCDCPPPFTGQFCEDYACVNGLSTGHQYDAKSFFFNKRCLCDPGWTGELCDKSLINRCGENGEDRRGKCICRQNFAGDRCQHVTVCIHGQLFNGKCACHYGWSGDFCDIIICHFGSPDPDQDYKSCICPKRYRGRYCDFCAEPSSSPPPECAEIGKGVVNVSSDSMPILFAVIITLGIVALFAIVYFICRKVKELQNAKTDFRQRRRHVEGHQSATAEHEMEALHMERCLAKHDEPPRYEDIVPSNSNYLPTSLAVIGDGSDKSENNSHQNKCSDQLRQSLHNMDQGTHAAEIASFADTVQENSEIITTMQKNFEHSACAPCDGENENAESARTDELPLPFIITDNNSAIENPNVIFLATHSPSIQNNFLNSNERENVALSPDLCKLQSSSLGNNNQSYELFKEREAKIVLEMIQETDFKPP